MMFPSYLYGVSYASSYKSKPHGKASDSLYEQPEVPPSPKRVDIIGGSGEPPANVASDWTKSVSQSNAVEKSGTQSYSSARLYVWKPSRDMEDKNMLNSKYSMSPPTASDFVPQ